MNAAHDIAQIRMRNIYFFLGFVMYFINKWSDQAINIPSGEFAILGLILIEFITKKKVLNHSDAFIAGIIAIVMVIWCTVVDYSHNGKASGSVRIFARFFVLYAIIVLYILLPNKRHVLLFITGMMSAHIINFFVQCGYQFLIARDDIFGLKYIIPTPSVVLLFYLLFKGNLSKPIGLLLIGCLVVSFLSLPFIGGRGAFLSLILAGVFYGLYATKIFTRSIMIYIILYVPFLTITIVGIFGLDLIRTLQKHEYDTISNVERILMLDTSIEIMRDYTMTGRSLSSFSAMYEDDFLELTVAKDTALSPHNFYMETAVPYGVPALIALLWFWKKVYHMLFEALKLAGHSRAYGSYACFSIAWIMLYQPVAGITRLDVIILLMIGLYGINSKNLYKKQEELHA